MSTTSTNSSDPHFSFQRPQSTSFERLFPEESFAPQPSRTVPISLTTPGFGSSSTSLHSKVAKLSEERKPIIVITIEIGGGRFDTINVFEDEAINAGEAAADFCLRNKLNLSFVKPISKTIEDHIKGYYARMVERSREEQRFATPLEGRPTNGDDEKREMAKKKSAKTLTVGQTKKTERTPSRVESKPAVAVASRGEASATARSRSRSGLRIDVEAAPPSARHAPPRENLTPRSLLRKQDDTRSAAWVFDQMDSDKDGFLSATRIDFSLLNLDLLELLTEVLGELEDSRITMSKERFLERLLLTRKLGDVAEASRKLQSMPPPPLESHRGAAAPRLRVKSVKMFDEDY